MKEQRNRARKKAQGQFGDSASNGEKQKKGKSK